MSKLTEKADIVRNQVWEACNELDKLKTELQIGGLDETSFPAVAKLQKVLMRANTTSTQLLNHVLGI